MLPIPDDILKHYEAVLKKRAVAISLHADYKKEEEKGHPLEGFCQAKKILSSKKS